MLCCCRTQACQLYTVGRSAQQCSYASLRTSIVNSIVKRILVPQPRIIVVSAPVQVQFQTLL
jgi:hypothetical protein